MGEDAGVRAWSALLRAHATLVTAIGHEVERRTGLPLAWYDALLELNASPGRRLRMSELGERVVLSRSRVSRVVDELERAGLAVREPDPSDGRATLARMTPAGRTAFRRAAPVYLAQIEERFSSRLSGSELRLIRDALERVLDDR